MAAYREGRRRKLLREDARGGGGAEQQSAGPIRKRSTKRIYSDAARHANQPRITDFIPQATLSFSLFGLAALLPPVALAIALFLSLGTPAQNVAGATRPAGNLAAAVVMALSQWWSCIILLTTAGIGGMIYHLRRYKLDDYRARYRVWLVTIVLLILGSADAATGLHRGIYSHLAMSLTTAQFATVHYWWGPIVVGLALFAFLRLTIEMWASRSACVVLFLAAASYAVGWKVIAAYWQPADPRWREVLVFSAVHMGHLLLALSMMLYCRHVYRSAQGGRSSSTKTKKTRRSSGSSESTSSTPPQTRRLDSDIDSDSNESHTSKSEHRRQRKEMRRHQRRAA